MTTNILNAGDLVYYVARHGDRPKTGSVSRVTKTQARVQLSPMDGDKEVGPFKREGWEGRHPIIGSSGYRSDAHIYPVNPWNEKMLNERADQMEIDRAEKAAEAKARQERILAEVASQLTEVKTAWFANDLRNPSSFGDTMPDGSRVYTIDIPVRPAMVERKKGWERLIVRCWADEEMDWRNGGTKDVVRSAYTYCNGGTSSFASCSTGQYTTDEEAVWDAIRREYHNW